MIQLIPLVTTGQVAFWVLAPLAVLFGIGMVLARKPVHSALFLAGVMVSLGLMYASLEAPFLFVTQIIVYTGAVLMLFVFVVMLVGVGTSDSIVETLKGHRIASFLAVIGLAGLLIAAIGQATFTGEPGALDAANAEFGGNAQGLAALFFTRYIFIFEATSALLITAAVAAMVLAHGERLKKKKRQPEVAADRMKGYAADGQHLGPLPPSGVYARNNAIHIPALLPDGSVSELSISPTLRSRGNILNVDELREPTIAAYEQVSDNHARAQGELE